MPGAVIRTFLVDGDPEGLRTVEVSNSTVLGTFFPRPSLDVFLNRIPAQRPGAYILIGLSLSLDDDEIEKVYIGEGDPVGPRLKEHAIKKEFWTQAAVFTSKDDYVTKTQIQFLESALVRATKEAGRAKLDNLNIPSSPNISEADQAEVMGFFETIKLFLGVSGFHFLRRWEKIASSKSEKEVFHYRIKSADARMVRSSSDYIVLAGSTAQPVTTPSAASWVKNTRDRLMDAGILTTIPNSPLLQFSKDTAFPSPSTAAAVIAGGNQNGLILWKLDDGRTLKEVEES